MRQYEVTFIVDPVLANDAIESTSRNYVEHLKNSNCEIVHTDAMGLRQLAYPIGKRTSGVYFCIEFKAETHDIIERLELALRRDERIIRFLTVKLDKYGVKYNDDKRKGLIGRRKETEAALVEDMKSATPQPQGPTPVAAAAVAVPATETVTESETTAEPVAETAAEPVAETAAEPVAETAAEPVAETAAEPVAETAAEPVADTVTEAVETPEPEATSQEPTGASEEE